MAFTDFDLIQFKPLGPCGNWRSETAFQWIETIIHQNIEAAIAIDTIPDRGGWRWAGHNPIYEWIDATQRQITVHSQIRWW